MKPPLRPMFRNKVRDRICPLVPFINLLSWNVYIHMHACLKTSLIFKFMTFTTIAEMRKRDGFSHPTTRVRGAVWENRHLYSEGAGWEIL